MTLKLIWEPTVYLAGRQTITTTGGFQHAPDLYQFYRDHHLKVEHHPGTTIAEWLTETAGRLCYMSFNNPRPGGNKAYLEHILEVGHGSVLEHAVWNFIFTGISRSLSHELVRHRAGWGYSQLSQRYVDSSDVAFVVPHDLQKEVKKGLPVWEEYGNDPCLARSDYDEVTLTGTDWLATQQNVLDQYEELTSYLASKLKNVEDKAERRKRARQTARSVLPNCTETKIFVTVNARALRNTIEQRCSRFAEPEIRKLFYRVWQIVRVEAPNIFDDYQQTLLPDGTVELTTTHRKV